MCCVACPPVRKCETRHRSSDIGSMLSRISQSLSFWSPASALCGPPVLFEITWMRLCHLLARCTAPQIPRHLGTNVARNKRREGLAVVNSGPVILRFQYQRERTLIVSRSLSPGRCPAAHSLSPCSSAPSPPPTFYLCPVCTLRSSLTSGWEILSSWPR